MLLLRVTGWRQDRVAFRHTILPGSAGARRPSRCPTIAGGGVRVWGVALFPRGHLWNVYVCSRGVHYEAITQLGFTTAHLAPGVLDVVVIVSPSVRSFVYPARASSRRRQ